MTLGSRRAARRPRRGHSSNSEPGPGHISNFFNDAAVRRVAMRLRVRYLTYVVSGSVVLGVHMLAQGQTPSSIPPPTWIPDIRFSSGRNVVPYLEGWIRNPDQSFDFVFGYFNRNSVQELAIPAGPYNSVMPGGPD